MKCQRCQSARVLHVSAKCGDRLTLHIGNGFWQGYNPGDCGIGAGGDYIQCAVCLDCGQAQGQYPLAQTTVEMAESCECICCAEPLMCADAEDNGGLCNRCYKAGCNPDEGIVRCEDEAARD